MTGTLLKDDLFLTKKEQVYQFIKQRGRCRTSEVAAFGVSIYHPDRACRDARELAREGRIWRMRKDLQEALYGNSREEFWSVREADR
ncbi:MAG: hypothetical protein WC312_03955 [Candidatus Omnitrophota bacterium]|jgi:hypothetical protein